MKTWIAFQQDIHSGLLDWETLSLSRQTTSEVISHYEAILILQEIFQQNFLHPSLFPTAEEAASALHSLCGYLTTKRWLAQPSGAIFNAARDIENYIKNTYPMNIQIPSASEGETSEAVWERRVSIFQFRLGLQLRNLLDQSARFLTRQFATVNQRPEKINREEKTKQAGKLGNAQLRFLKELMSDNIDTINGSSLAPGIRVLYLERAIKEPLQMFLNSLDRLYFSHPEQCSIDVIRALKLIHDLYHDNDIKFDIYGNKSALSHYFGSIGKKIDHKSFQQIIRGIIHQAIEQAISLDATIVQQQKAIRLSEEQEMKEDPGWRTQMDLPYDQRQQEDTAGLNSIFRNAHQDSAATRTTDDTSITNDLWRRLMLDVRENQIATPLTHLQYSEPLDQPQIQNASADPSYEHKDELTRISEHNEYDFYEIFDFSMMTPPASVAQQGLFGAPPSTSLPDLPVAASPTLQQDQEMKESSYPDSGNTPGSMLR